MTADLATRAAKLTAVALVALHTAYGAFALFETPPAVLSVMVLVAMVTVAFAVVEAVTSTMRPLFGWTLLATWAALVATAWAAFVGRIP